MYSTARSYLVTCPIILLFNGIHLPAPPSTHSTKYPLGSLILRRLPLRLSLLAILHLSLSALLPLNPLLLDPAIQTSHCRFGIPLTREEVTLELSCAELVRRDARGEGLGKIGKRSVEWRGTESLVSVR
jgi:hypothetical protein